MLVVNEASSPFNLLSCFKDKFSWSATVSTNQAPALWRVLLYDWPGFLSPTINLIGLVLIFYSSEVSSSELVSTASAAGKLSSTVSVDSSDAASASSSASSAS